MRPRLSDVYRLSEVWLCKILNLAEDFFLRLAQKDQM